MIRGRTLLVEGLGFCAVHKTLQDDGPVADAVQCAGSHGEIVTDKIQLRELHICCEVQFVRMSNRYGVTVYR